MGLALALAVMFALVVFGTGAATAFGHTELGSKLMAEWLKSAGDDTGPR